MGKHAPLPSTINSQLSPLNPAAAGSGYRRTINCGHAPLAWPPPPHSSVSMFVAMMLPSG